MTLKLNLSIYWGWREKDRNKKKEKEKLKNQYTLIRSSEPLNMNQQQQYLQTHKNVQSIDTRLFPSSRPISQIFTVDLESNKKRISCIYMCGERFIFSTWSLV